MALKSMTGYGRGEAISQGRVWTAEVRCVNNRFLDPKVKLPRDYTSLEDMIRKLVGEFHQRGRVDLVLSVAGDFSDLVEVRIDTALATAYKTSLEKLAKRYGLGCELDAAVLAGFPDVIVREQKQEDTEKISHMVREAVYGALSSCREMRMREGTALVKDLSERLALFEQVLGRIEERIPELVNQRELALKERLEKLLDTAGIDPMRLAQEVAIIADKSDVTEEIVRLRSHIGQFAGLLENSEAVGRKLDFLIQEFLREVNTMASKISDAQIAHMTVDLKSELEKMREQVQNIE